MIFFRSWSPPKKVKNGKNIGEMIFLILLLFISFYSIPSYFQITNKMIYQYKKKKSMDKVNNFC